MHISAERSSYAKAGQSCTRNGLTGSHGLSTPHQNHQSVVNRSRHRSPTLHRPLTKDAVSKTDAPPHHHRTQEHPFRCAVTDTPNSTVGKAFRAARTERGQWPLVRHKRCPPSSWSSSPSFSSSPPRNNNNQNRRRWPRWRIRWHLAVAVFVIDYCSLLMLPTHVGAAKGLPDRIPVGECTYLHLNNIINHVTHFFSFMPPK